MSCEYEVNIKHTKEKLLELIHELSAKDKLTDFILSVLLPDDQTSLDVLRALRNGDSHERIVEWMGLVSLKEQRVLSYHITNGMVCLKMCPEKTFLKS